MPLIRRAPETGASPAPLNPTQRDQIQAQTRLLGAQRGLTKAQAGAVQQRLDLQRQLFTQLFGGGDAGGSGLFGELLGIGSRAVDGITGGIGAGLGGGVSQPGFRDDGSGGTPDGGQVFPQQIVGGRVAENLVGQIQQLGQAERSRINRRTEDVTGTALARLENRGFGGSASLLGGSLGAIEGGREQAILNLNDQLLGQQLGVQERSVDRVTGLLGQLLGGLI